MPTTTPSSEDVAAVIRVRTFVYGNEDELQRGIATVLDAAFPGQVEREVRIDARSRLDFRVGAVVAVEVKIDGTISELTRQVHRYAGLDGIQGVVAVVGKHRLRGLPDTMQGKPVVVVHLSGAL